MDSKKHDANESQNPRQAEVDRTREAASSGANPNPPRTTTGKLTAPMFGNAVSGGFELEPGPEKL